MSDHAPADPDASVTTPESRVEAYETEDSVVLYDALNPLAWVETTQTLRLDEQL